MILEFQDFNNPNSILGRAKAPALPALGSLVTLQMETGEMSNAYTVKAVPTEARTHEPDVWSVIISENG